jgi:hypothetical protein
MTRASYYAVAKFSGENLEALRLMEAMIKAPRHRHTYTYI